jgi:hypothetical protein
MTNEKLEQKIENNSTNKDNNSNNTENGTEYRIIKNRTYIADYYLQFKSTKQVKNFPDVWNTHEVECWRYIPQDKYHIFDYLDENKCPTTISLGQENALMSCFYNQESYDLIPFTKQYSNIRLYFEKFNSLRDKHIQRIKKVRYSKLQKSFAKSFLFQKFKLNFCYPQSQRMHSISLY